MIYKIINNYSYFFKDDVFPQLSSRQKYCAIVAIALSILLIGYCSVKFVQTRIWKTKKLKENNLHRDASLSPIIIPPSSDNQKCDQPDPTRKEAVYFFQEAEKNRTANPALAFEYFLKAAKMNHIHAQFEVGMLFKDGIGVTENGVQAFKWLKKSAKAGNVLAQYHLGICCYHAIGLPGSDRQGSFKWYKLAAEANYAPAQYLLALCYWFGDGVLEDQKEYLKWITRAADSGHREALEDLAEYYDCHKADNQEALKLYLRAANLGSSIAKKELARIYKDGKGVTKDLKEAFSWYSKAVEGGSIVANDWLAIWFKNI